MGAGVIERFESRDNFPVAASQWYDQHFLSAVAL